MLKALKGLLRAQQGASNEPRCCTIAPATGRPGKADASAAGAQADAAPLRALLSQLEPPLLLRLLRARLPPTDEEMVAFCGEDDGTGSCLIHHAASVGDLPLLRACLAADASLVRLEGTSGMQPLHCAVEAYQADAVAILLEAGADANAADWDGKTPAMHLAAAGSTLTAEQHAVADAILALLLGAGMDVAARDEQGCTALNGALQARNIALACLLLKHGGLAGLRQFADADLLCDVIDVASGNAADAAYGVLAPAVESCEDPNTPAAVLSLLSTLLDSGAPVQDQGVPSGARVPLLVAASAAPALHAEHAAALLELLLRHGGDAEAVDELGRDCFHHLVLSLDNPAATPEGMRAALGVLLGAAGGAAALNALNCNRSTPAGQLLGLRSLDAAGEGQWWCMVACLRALVDAGADLNAAQGDVPLPHLLVRYDSLETQSGTPKPLDRRRLGALRLLCDAGWDVNATNEHGQTTLGRLLQFAIFEIDEFTIEGRETCVCNATFWALLEELLSRGADPNIFPRDPSLWRPDQQRSWWRDDDCRRRSTPQLPVCPLACALVLGPKVAARLVAAGADVAAGDETGAPLVHVLWAEFLRIVRGFAQIRRRCGGNSWRGEDWEVRDRYERETRGHLLWLLDSLAVLRGASAPLPSRAECQLARHLILDVEYGAENQGGDDDDDEEGVSNNPLARLYRRSTSITPHTQLTKARRAVTGTFCWQQRRLRDAPAAFREAVQLMLLINRCRGFPGCVDSAAGLAEASCGPARRMRRRQHDRQQGQERAAGAEAAVAPSGAAAAGGAATAADGHATPVSGSASTLAGGPDLPQGPRVSLEPEILLHICQLAGQDLTPWWHTSLRDDTLYVSPWAPMPDREWW